MKRVYEKSVVQCLFFLSVFFMAIISSAYAGERIGNIELPDDINDPAIAWVEPGETPSIDSLSDEDIERLSSWLIKKQKNMKPGDVVIIYKEKSEDIVEVFQPSDFTGKAFRGGLGQELTDGRLTIKVTDAKKESYSSFYGVNPKFPFQFVVAYMVENQGQADIKVKSLKYYFFNHSGILETGTEIRNLKKEGNNYTETDEPEIYETKSKGKTTMSTRGDCKDLNNVCLQFSYTDGTETMFVVYIPPAEIIDETSTTVK